MPGTSTLPQASQSVMNPTPVRVRGKRKTSTKPKNEKPKKTRRSLASVLASRSVRQRPTLESLPSEMLESILLYSTNLSLPRASHVIGMKLSDRATLLRLFIWAFHDTWDQWFGIARRQPVDHASRIPGEDETPCQGDDALQTAMLKLPWVKIDFILQAQQAWANRYAPNRWYSHSLSWRGGADGLGHDHDGGFSHFNAHRCFEVDYQQALKWPPFHNRSLSEWRSQDIHPRARIPAHLIAGPWDDEKLRRLFWLTRGSAMTHHQAQGNVLVINCLTPVGILRHLPQDVGRKWLVHLNRRIETGVDSPEIKEMIRSVRDTLYPDATMNISSGDKMKT